MRLPDANHGEGAAAAESTAALANRQAEQAATTPCGTPAAADRKSLDGLYLHLPFCFHKCHYCDFYSVVDRPGHDRQADFTDALIRELRSAADRHDLRPSTVFCGGGTPTLLRAELWQRLLGTLWELGVLDRCEEFTVEANPETVSRELMDQLVTGGVNRVSIGAQSFQRPLLQMLERWHDPDNVGRAVRLARDAGIDDVSLDLIFATPGQDVAMLDADLDAALALGPDHLSVYGLTYEPGTAMTARLRAGRVTRCDEDVEADMFDHVGARLAAEGFGRYEISNWARPAHACGHNLMYWTGGDWRGIGPSAASHVAGHRWRNAPDLARYLADSPDPPTLDHERLAGDDAVGERLMLMLRLRRGVPAAWLDENVPADHPRREELHQLRGLGLLEWHADHLRLTDVGLRVADSVIARLL